MLVQKQGPDIICATMGLDAEGSIPRAVLIAGPFNRHHRTGMGVIPGLVLRFAAYVDQIICAVNYFFSGGNAWDRQSAHLFRPAKLPCVDREPPSACRSAVLVSPSFPARRARAHEPKSRQRRL